MKQQLNREARWAVWLSLLYLLSWCIFAYLLPVERGLFGFPLWFEFACIYLPIGFTLAVFIMVKVIYKTVDLENENE